MLRLLFMGTEQQIRGKLPRCAVRNPHSSQLSLLFMMLSKNSPPRKLTTNLQLHMQSYGVKGGSLSEPERSFMGFIPPKPLISISSSLVLNCWVRRADLLVF